MTNQQKYERLITLLNEVTDLRHVVQVLSWDQKVCMPKAGIGARGRQMATINGLAHERITSQELGELLADLSSYERSLPYESVEASTIRITRREYEKETFLPSQLLEEIVLAGAAGYDAWLQAREAGDFDIFRPALERVHRAMMAKACALGYSRQPMDAFVNEYEPGLTVARVEALFSELKLALVPLVAAIRERATPGHDSLLNRDYDADAQWRVGLEAVSAIGLDIESRGRVDVSVHPFSTSFSPDDVRITTRIGESGFDVAFYALLHEAGHGLYEQGLPRHLDRSSLCAGASEAIHESQARLWENVVGRSHEFCEFFYPTIRRHFPEQTAGVSLEDFYRAVNTVRPTLIRTTADEVTYNLHIMIRTELEKAVFGGTLAIADLEQAWNDMYKEYLGVVPGNPNEGILQDIHWVGGFGGAFVSYAIGNVVSVQLFDAAYRQVPDLREGLAKGRFEPLLHWMNQHVHVHGAKYQPLELVRMASGAELSAQPYLDYIRSKYSVIYGL